MMKKVTLGKKFAAMGLVVAVAMGTFAMPVFAKEVVLNEQFSEVLREDGQDTLLFKVIDCLEQSEGKPTVITVKSSSEIKVINGATKKEIGTVKLGTKLNEDKDYANTYNITREDNDPKYDTVTKGETYRLEYSKLDSGGNPLYYDGDMLFFIFADSVDAAKEEPASEPTPAPATAPQPAPIPVVAETPAPQPMPVTTNTATATATAPMQTTEQKATYITTGDLNVRAATTTNSKILSVLKKGTYPLVLEKTGNWYKIDLGSGKTGFISASYVKDTSNTPATSAPSNAVTKTVNTGALNVRSSAGVGNNIIGVVRNGDIVTVTGTQNGWAKINYNNGIGFIDGNYLK